MLGLVGRLNKTTVSSQYHQVEYILNLYPYLRYISHRHQWGWITTSIKRNKSLRKKSFNWTISTQYTQQYYHLFQTFNMPWRRGTARILRGLPIQISRLIRTTYSVIYWHLCTIPLLQKITFVDRHVAIASRHLLLLLSLLERNLLLDVWEPPWQGATSPWPALCGRGAERLLLGKSWNLEGANWLPDAPKLLLHCLFRHPEYEMRGCEGLSMYLLIKWLAMPA